MGNCGVKKRKQDSPENTLKAVSQTRPEEGDVYKNERRYIQGIEAHP